MVRKSAGAAPPLGAAARRASKNGLGTARAVGAGAGEEGPCRPLGAGRARGGAAQCVHTQACSCKRGASGVGAWFTFWFPAAAKERRRGPRAAEAAVLLDGALTTPPSARRAARGQGREQQGKRASTGRASEGPTRQGGLPGALHARARGPTIGSSSKQQTDSGPSKRGAGAGPARGETAREGGLYSLRGVRGWTDGGGRRGVRHATQPPWVKERERRRRVKLSCWRRRRRRRRARGAARPARRRPARAP
jgi:hypothetical protein